MMSMALCDVIPLMELINEMRESKFDIVNTQPYVYWFLLITPAHVSWPDSQDSTHALSISMCTSINFVSMSGKA